MISGSPCQNLMLLIFVKRKKETNKKTLCFSSKFPLLKLLILSSIHTVLISLFHFILYIFLTVTKCPQHVTFFIIYSSMGSSILHPFPLLWSGEPVQLPRCAQHYLKFQLIKFSWLLQTHKKKCWIRRKHYWTISVIFKLNI